MFNFFVILCPLLAGMSLAIVWAAKNKDIYPRSLAAIGVNEDWHVSLERINKRWFLSIDGDFYLNIQICGVYVVEELVAFLMQAKDNQEFVLTEKELMVSMIYDIESKGATLFVSRGRFVSKEYLVFHCKINESKIKSLLTATEEMQLDLEEECTL